MKWKLKKAKFLCQQHSVKKALRKNLDLRGRSNFSAAKDLI